MGIRPSMYLIIGCEGMNPKDRIRGINHETELTDDLLFPGFKHIPPDIEYRKLNIPGYQFRYIDDLIYNLTGADDCREPGLVGMKIDKSKHDSQLMRAWAAIDDIYELSGHKIIVPKPMSDWLIERYGYEQEDVDCHRNIPIIETPGVARWQWRRAWFYLKLCGWNVAEQNLYYYIVWDWS